MQTEGGFFVVTNQGNWGKSLNLDEAFKNAKTKLDTKETKYQITIMLFQPNTPQDIKENLMKCYSVDDFGGIRRVYELEEGDEQQIKDYLLGWCQTDNKHVFEKKGVTV